MITIAIKMFLRSITIQNKKKEAKHQEQKNKRIEKGAIEKSRKYFNIDDKLHDN